MTVLLGGMRSQVSVIVTMALSLIIQISWIMTLLHCLICVLHGNQMDNSYENKDQVSGEKLEQHHELT